MSSTLDTETQLTGWRAAWIARETPTLQYYTYGLICTHCSVLIFLGVQALLLQRRTHRALEANPSSRAAILATHEKKMASSLRTVHHIGLHFVTNAVLLYFVDAGITFSGLKQEAARIGWSMEPSFLLRFVLIFVLVLAVAIITLLGTFVLVPVAQVALVSWCVARRFPGEARISLADYIPEARIIVTYMAQTWAMLEFLVIALWPPRYYSLLRTACFMATCGSSGMWGYASVAFNFQADRLDEVEVTGVLGWFTGIVRWFGLPVVDFQSFSKGSSALPKYEIPVQIEVSSEKEAL